MKQLSGIYFGKSTLGMIKNETHFKSTKIIDQGEVEYKKGVIAPWGADNQFPSKLLQQTGLNGAASGGLSLLKATHYGNGLSLYKNTKDEQSSKRKKELYHIEDDPLIDYFFKRNKMSSFWTGTIGDLETFGICYPTFLISKDYKKILTVKRQPAAWGRRELMNPSSGFSENVYFKTKWEDDSTEKAARIATVDPSWCLEEIQDYCKRKRIYEFTLPTHYTMMEEAYYPKLTWHAIFHNGWLEVSNSIPEFKKHLFENQLNIKFIVYISDEYFEQEYGDDWMGKFDANKRKKIREETLRAIDDHLTGNTASGRSMYVRKVRTDTGWEKGIEVEPINHSLKDGSYLPEASAANTEILFAMMVDATLIGGGVPGGNMGGGSGSDKRIAFSILSALFKTKRDTTLSIWELIRDWNRWDADLKAGFENVLLTTLDKNPTGQQNVL